MSNSCPDARCFSFSIDFSRFYTYNDRGELNGPLYSAFVEPGNVRGGEVVVLGLRRLEIGEGFEGGGFSDLCAGVGRKKGAEKP